VGQGRALPEIISAFGEATRRKLANRAASGAPEDQLRAPLEDLVGDLAELGLLVPDASDGQLAKAMRRRSPSAFSCNAQR